MSPTEAMLRRWLESGTPGEKYHASVRLGLPIEEDPRPTPSASMAAWRAMEECPHHEKRPGCCAGAACTFPWRRRWTTFAECSACLKRRGIA